MLNGEGLSGWNDQEWPWKASLVSWDNSGDVLLFLSALVGSKRCARQEHGYNIWWALHLVVKNLVDSCRALVNIQSFLCTHSLNYKCLWAVLDSQAKIATPPSFLRFLSLSVFCCAMFLLLTGGLPKYFLPFQWWSKLNTVCKYSSALKGVCMLVIMK